MLLLPLLLLGQQRTLWQIGQSDYSPLELGLAPGGYQQYRVDPVFVVGQSTARDWPYVLPGPVDGWAGSRRHRGQIFFGLDAVPSEDLELNIEFCDTHPNAPPKIAMGLNGHELIQFNTDEGSGDDVVLGKATMGKWTRNILKLRKQFLHAGTNVVSIENVAGSWAVFDDIRVEGPAGVKLIDVPPIMQAQAMPQDQAILRTDKGPRQPVSIDVTNIGPAGAATITVPGLDPIQTQLTVGSQTVRFELPPVKKTTILPVRITTASMTVLTRVTVEPVRPWTVYLCPHSHVDIGYTNLQTYILDLHKRNLVDAMQVTRESAINPADSMYRFNVEATWPVDQYVKAATPSQLAALRAALQAGTIHMSASYANLLTGVAQPEELMQSYRYSRILQDKLGLKFETASQTDVPGVTWGTVVALHEAGIKHLFLMPNWGDRIGGVRKEWENKPFWWVGPSGREKVLVWEPNHYSEGTSAGWDGNRDKMVRTDHPTTRFIDKMIFEKLGRLNREGYPYDMLAEPWSVVDNAPIDSDVPKAAKAWNEKYVYPHVVLSTLSNACETLVRRYGKQLPVVKGDLTPYWEDGTGSSEAETSLNRITPNRLIQAETWSAMRQPATYPREKFLDAWRNVVLYSEHTWGAWNSISEPDNAGVKAQWKIKRDFARNADAQSKALLAVPPVSSPTFDVTNTTSWVRSELVTIPAASSQGLVRAEVSGRPVPSQRLANGDVAVLVSAIPPLAKRTVRLVPGAPLVSERVTVRGNVIASSSNRVVLDPATGAIASWKNSRGVELVDSKAPHRLGQYLYLTGTDLAGLRTTSQPTLKVVDAGPLVVTVQSTQPAAGTNHLTQQLRVVAGLDRIQWSVSMDKQSIRAKEAVHIAFPLNVPGGQMRIDMPWAVVRPEKDQLVGANKNWLPTQQYVDVSNAKVGVTCTSIDAPLIEVGEISANLLGSQSDPTKWRQHIKPTQTFYSWALNNHWHTNYLADQSGPLTFRYELQSHAGYRADEAVKFGLAARQPVMTSAATKGDTASFLTVSDPSVIVTRLVPSDDGKATLVRLYGTTAGVKHVRLGGRLAQHTRRFRSDLSQKPLGKLGSVIEVPGYGVTTIRIENQ